MNRVINAASFMHSYLSCMKPHLWVSETDSLCYYNIYNMI